MQPLEIKLNREFKKLQKELEDYWFDEGNDKISNFVDKIARENLFKIQDVAKEIDTICKSEDFAIEKFNGLINNFLNITNKFKKYLEDNDSNFRKDLMENAMGNSKVIIKEMQTLIAIAYYSNLQKLANQMECRIQQTIGRITFILNTVTDEIINPYKKLINDEIDRVVNILHDKAYKIKREETKNKDNKISIKKLFDYKKMDKLIKDYGFEEIRQTGDHKIYSNGEKSIPIPQHELGKGLSFKIQKQIS
ncbi:type II toxin-antitoxin system HicA family toxin [Clostridium botulinum]|uniref:type II toxin-antitoxin system HicA family toxin n=1 Tax=Clostridium botulinum TaxID=1491 RepID=UPI00016BA520|nr:type II toxin-antitoxin system HicA family toxin [Clostridium botulinum]AJD26744.1 ycfA-like family protein [Clostridium botulinum CDC_297]AJE11189.1 ycfA-like family protein [Clostridium botulinum CDC_1436]EDT84570.1 dihydroorotate dehydrogenase, electron transfer subunit [Clostridium botulinum Bf]MBN3411214.1 type II toxin-antitoxin system HicA family toxin [Clostridium botulinum]MBY6878119.1 type II toxin-antitoxin system HicA family toxin [Clostridium botulinum]